MVFQNIWSGFKNLFSTEVELQEPFTFPKLEKLNEVIKKFKIDEEAKKDGEKNLPRSDRKNLSAAEEKIKGHYYSIMQNSKKFGTEYSNNVKQNIDNSGIMTVDAKIDNYKKDSTNWFNEKKKESKNFKYFDNEKIKDATNRYNEFRKKHSLNRRANFPPSLVYYYATVSALFLAECLINGLFLKEVTRSGIMGGIGIAVIISFFNVWIGFLYGRFVLPFKNHFNGTVKFFGFLSLLIILVWFLCVNFFVAHYRDLIVVNNEIAFIEVVQFILASPLEIKDFISFALLVVGIVFGVSAVGSGYKSDDPYPGFGAAERFKDNTMKRYADTHYKYLMECKDHKDHLIREIRELYKQMRIKYKSINQMIDLFTTLGEKYEIQIKRINSECKQAIMHYRNENERVRADKPPKYFEKPFIFEETGRLNVDINDQTKMVLKLKNKVSTIEKDQKEIVKHIESKYEDATKKVQDLVDFHSEELER